MLTQWVFSRSNRTKNWKVLLKECCIKMVNELNGKLYLECLHVGPKHLYNIITGPQVIAVKLWKCLAKRCKYLDQWHLSWGEWYPGWYLGSKPPSKISGRLREPRIETTKSLAWTGLTVLLQVLQLPSPSIKNNPQLLPVCGQQLNWSEVNCNTYGGIHRYIRAIATIKW